MNSTLERAISYILGGVIGYGAGVILSLPSMHLMDPEYGSMVTPITSIVGLLIAMVIVEFRYERFMKRNNAIRDETVALITHEMRTSLTSTGWAIGMVLTKYDSTVSSEDKKLLKGVVDSIHTTVMHSVNLLDVSLLDIGKLSISLEWTKLSKVQEMITEMLDKYALGAVNHGLTLDHEVKLDGTKMAEVDLLRLRIILENLLENAIQYTADGFHPDGREKKITVIVSNDEKEMHMSVGDTGIGIPDSEKEKIFSEFYRASNARRKLSSGSGIGLYTCASYVKAHRGSIRFESKENVGTTFFISIPLKTEADVKGFLEKI